MATEQDKAQVFDLIQRIMKAAETDVLGDEAQGAKVLGFEIRDWVEELTEHAKIPRREIATGISILDQSPIKEHITYGWRNHPEPLWGASVAKIGYLVCIRRAEIEALYGKPDRMYAPPHGQRDGAGSYDYVTETKKGTRTAVFGYILRDNGKECLNYFSVKLVLNKTSSSAK